LIWDFRGPDALKMAEHHAIHLEEFATTEKLHFHNVGFDELSNLFSIAFIVVDEAGMPVYRDALKPHRGEVA
jgi:hypothetical protein